MEKDALPEVCDIAVLDRHSSPANLMYAEACPISSDGVACAIQSDIVCTYDDVVGQIFGEGGVHCYGQSPDRERQKREEEQGCNKEKNQHTLARNGKSGWI